MRNLKIKHLHSIQIILMIICLLIISDVVCISKVIDKDGFEFNLLQPVIKNDSIFCQDRDASERIVYDYYGQLLKLDTIRQERSLSFFLNTLKSKDVFHKFVELTDLYLNDPYSPLKNEYLFLRSLHLFLGSAHCMKNDSLIFIEKIRLLKLNSPGTSSQNFTYYIGNFKTTLFETGSNKQYKLLFFYSPECDDCTDAIQWLSRNNTVNTLIKENRLVILAISDSTKSHKTIPKNWVEAVSYDYGHSYNIPVVPSIYLLSPDNKVIFKDITDVTVLNDYLTRL